MTKAVTLAELADNNVLSVDGTNNRVGIASTQPTATLDVAGIVSATAYYGDGSNLEGVASAGLGTALGDANGADVIYYTDKVLTVTADVDVDPPTGANVAYTQYAEVAVADSYDLTVADGDDFIPDILGLSTSGVTPISGAGGRVRADNFTDHAGTGAPTFQTGLQVTGVVTATTANITGNMTVAGVLTYEDVTNVDSVGLVTARSGVLVGSGQSYGSTDGATAVYYGDGSNLTGVSAGLAASTITLQTWLFGGG